MDMYKHIHNILSNSSTNKCPSQTHCRLCLSPRTLIVLSPQERKCSRLHLIFCPDLMNWSLIQVSQFSCSVASDSLQPHGLQHARTPCPSPTPGACSNSCPSSQ